MTKRSQITVDLKCDDTHHHRNGFHPSSCSDTWGERSSDAPTQRCCLLSIQRLTGHPHTLNTSETELNETVADLDAEMLSLIQSKVVPYRCEPAKKDRPRTNGRSVPPDLWIKPSAVAICCRINKSISKTEKGHMIHII